jgi:acyl-coenzyme A thioesterase PaaI-like protein
VNEAVAPQPVRSLQERFAPAGRCFGCGPANGRGLRIRSQVAADGTVVATWSARPEHEAWDGIVNGGILGTLVDCHSNWTAIAGLMARDGLSEAPSTVTAELAIRFRRPTPSAEPIRLVGRVVEMTGERVTVETTVWSGDVVTATGRATFVRVGPDHPAYGRW